MDIQGGLVEERGGTGEKVNITPRKTDLKGSRRTHESSEVV